MSAKSRPRAKKAKNSKANAKPKKAQPKRPVKAAPPTQKPKKQPKEKKVKEQKPAAQSQPKTERVELGPAPAAAVAARHMDSMHERKGRGFSFGELASAGVSMAIALRQNLSLDVRRRSVVEGNVEALKAWLKAPAPVKS